MAKVKQPERQKLTRKDMEEIIKDGGSVMHGGEIITKVEELPDEVDLAETPEEIEAAKAAIAADEQAVASRKEKAEGKAAKKPTAKAADKK